MLRFQGRKVDNPRYFVIAVAGNRSIRDSGRKFFNRNHLLEKYGFSNLSKFHTRIWQVRDVPLEAKNDCPLVQSTLTV